MIYDEVDEAILSVVRDRSKKTARVITEARDTLVERKGLSDTEASSDEILNTIAERISALAACGLLASYGNLSRWRHSEVSLPGGSMK